MTNAPIVLQTARCSVVSQIFFTMITATTIALPQDENKAALVPIAVLETISQVIEFTYYVAALCYFKEITTWTRYLDWFLSTPLMLVSTMAFLLFLQDNTNTMGTLFQSEYVFYTLSVLGFNWLMLTFGVLVELGATQRPMAFLTLGTVSFIASFVSLLIGFVGKTTLGAGLVLFMYIVWGMYGIAATFETVAKNIAYNLLDIVSKNFYGVFLFVYGVAVL